MENITFSTVLKDILFQEDTNLKEFHSRLNNLNLNITYPSLYAYYTGTTVPKYSVAKNILKKSHYNISNDELENLLQYSNEFKEKEKNIDIQKKLNLTVKIKPELVSNEYAGKPNALKKVIELRSQELFTDKEFAHTFDLDKRSGMSAYITYLIKKDLEENNMIEGVII